MSKLEDLRTELADVMATLGLTTYTHVPGRLDLPGAYVQAGNPYLSGGQTFGEKLVRFEVIAAVETGDNYSETEALDSLIESGLEALENAGWLVEEISQPFILSVNNALSLAIQYTVSANETF